jgi:hypothetical protein
LFDGPPTTLIVGPPYGFGFQDNFESDAIVKDELVHLEMLDDRGAPFFEDDTRQRDDRTFFVYFERGDAGQIVLRASYTEQQVDGSECERVITRTLAQTTRLYLPNRCNQGAYKPRSVIVTCGDGGVVLKRVRWRHWDKPVATGRSILRANNCQPSCAEGHYLSYHAALRVYRIRRCDDTGKYGAPVELWVKIRRPDTGFGGQPEDPAGRAGWGSCATRARRRRAGEAGVAEPRAARQATGIPGSVLASNSWFAGILVA